jgi:prepilin-type processing-associated H-X9-DG protein
VQDPYDFQRVCRGVINQQISAAHNEKANWLFCDIPPEMTQVGPQGHASACLENSCFEAVRRLRIYPLLRGSKSEKDHLPRRASEKNGSFSAPLADPGPFTNAHIMPDVVGSS